MTRIFIRIFYHLKTSFLSPLPLRVYLLRSFVRKFDIGSFKFQTEIDAHIYPGYAYCLYSAALQAKRLGISEISAIEFGVATGLGLMAMEEYASKIKLELDVDIVTFGFDTGIGMPKPIDYRDQGYFWQEADFIMDQEKLKRSLKKTTLLIGNVSETVPKFFEGHKIPPIGFIAFDLDYYSSTKASFEIFKNDDYLFLPRVETYMDDICSSELLYASSATGVLAAISEFNNENSEVKILKKEGVSNFRHIPEYWNNKIFALHRFKHPLYTSSMFAI